jgi:hypothetical protein
MFFREDKAPQGAGTRCLTDCPIETDCLYSARKLYLDHPTRWKFYVWDSLPGGPDASLEEKREALATTSPFGRCIWKCDNDVVDHQTVAIEFEGGATATLNMIGGCAKGSRKLHIIGTKGEIFGNFEDHGRYDRRARRPWRRGPPTDGRFLQAPARRTPFAQHHHPRRFGQRAPGLFPRRPRHARGPDCQSRPSVNERAARYVRTVQDPWNPPVAEQRH